MIELRETRVTKGVDLAVGGMTCSMCSDAVKRALSDIEGVQDVSVSLATNLAHIEYTESETCSVAILRETVEDIGYDVTDVIIPTKKSSIQTPASAKNATIKLVSQVPEKTIEMAIGGMTCSMCSSAVHKALMDVAGVKRVNVSLSTNTAEIEFEESANCNASSLRETVEDIGYDVNGLVEIVSSKLINSSKVIEMAVGGMTCSMCSSAVHKALMDVAGVKRVNVSLSTNTAEIEFEESANCNASLLRETVEDIGYDAGDPVELTTLDDCNTNVSSALYSDDPSRNVDIETDAWIDEPDDRLHRILKQQEAQLRARQSSFMWCLTGTLPIITITMFLPKVLDEGSDIMTFLKGTQSVLGHSFIRESLILWVLATPVQFGSGYSLYKTAYYGIRRRIYGMDVLVTLGMTASYLYATMAAFQREQGYRFFETSVVLLCFVLLGKWMNAMAVCKTSDALTSLMKLQTKTALKIRPKVNTKGWNPLIDPYEEETVPIQQINPGDIVKVLKGASIPADGELVHGEMCVDESMITGESIPVLKTPGSNVLGGTICTETGNESTHYCQVTAAAFVRVTGVGSSTALAQIVQLVQDAQSRQVPIQNLADSMASVFVPSVVLASFLTFLAWYGCCKGGVVPTEWYQDENENAATFSLLFGISCLVISCPCALGLATPTAVMVGTGVGARLGVLMKGGETLEVAGKVDVVIFDKTGTLTQGKPVVTDFTRVVPDDVLMETSNSMSMSVDDCLVWLLGSVERNSEHPLAAAIVAHAQDHLGDGRQDFGQPSNFVASTGRGASATMNGNISVAIGNRAFACREKLEITEEVERHLQELEDGGKTAILAGINGIVCAVLGVADELKNEAHSSVLHLLDMGVDVWMVTGDSRRTADAIARQLNLSPDRVISEALPSSKVDQVRKLQDLGKLVAMVGDGVNDSPALAEADVGISMGTGAEIAAEASDMVLVSGRVSDTCTALDLSRVIFRRIQLNLLFSMIYNLLSIPLAAGLFFPILHARLPPTVAAIAMALSSVSVVCSSLALRWYKPPEITSRGTTKRRRKGLRRLLQRSADYSKVALDDSDNTRPIADIV